MQVDQTHLTETKPRFGREGGELANVLIWVCYACDCVGWICQDDPPIHGYHEPGQNDIGQIRRKHMQYRRDAGNEQLHCHNRLWLRHGFEGAGLPMGETRIS